jgi:hypothetical protein
MALRDRVTIRTDQGQDLAIQVTRQGGDLDLSVGRKPDEWTIVEERNSAKSQVSELRVMTGHVVSILRDVAPAKPDKPKRTRRPKAES